MTEYHVPVMLNECIDALNIKPDGVYVDVTFGGGGHSKLILSKLNDKGVLVAFDQDEDAKRNVPKDKRLVFIDQNFRFLKNHLQYQELLPVDGLLADLGVSSHQFDVDERGFSFRFPEAKLDMRMSSAQKTDASHILNTYTDAQLADVFYYYGELKQARAMSRQIVSSRGAKPFETVADLRDSLQAFAPKFKDYKFWAQVFQALRIEINQELEVLKQFLMQCKEVISQHGRLVIMSYHSLEDRLVKNFINTGNFEGETEKDFYGNIIRPFAPVGKKMMTASAEEVQRNPRARSAKLRIAEKL